MFGGKKVQRVRPLLSPFEDVGENIIVGRISKASEERHQLTLCDLQARMLNSRAEEIRAINRKLIKVRVFGLVTQALCFSWFIAKRSATD